METTSNIKQVISEVLALLFTSDKKDAIRKAMRLLIDFFEVDWVYIATFENEHRIANFLYEETSPWVQTSKEDASELSHETIPWMIDTLFNGKDIILHTMEDVPQDAPDRKLFEAQGLLSMLAIPLTFHKKIQGFIGFDSVRIRRHWTQAEVEDLHIIANIFPIVIERLQAQQEAQEEKRKNEMEKRQIMEADKLKSAFLASMSHEIRTPLNAIVGFSNIIAETDDKEERIHYQEIINQNSNILLQLFTDMIDFAKIESGAHSYNLGFVNLKKMCEEIHLSHKNKCDKLHSDTRFIFRPESHEDLILYTDSKRVAQIITNLISNAFKFTKQGCVTLSYKVVKKNVHIYITDTGIGIAPDCLDTIFQRFTKLNDFSQGSGLGLSICKTIAKALKGNIGLTSKPDKGSTFWLELPLPKDKDIKVIHSQPSR